MPLGSEILPDDRYLPKNRAAMRQETCDFLTHARQQGVAVMARLQYFASQHDDARHSSKQLATAFRKEKQIPASYKLLLQDLFAQLNPAPDGKGKAPAVTVEATH